MIRLLQGVHKSSAALSRVSRKFADGYIKSLKFCFDAALLGERLPPKGPRQALISTSTPEGRSSLDNASTVLEEEV